MSGDAVVNEDALRGDLGVEPDTGLDTRSTITFATEDDGGYRIKDLKDAAVSSAAHPFLEMSLAYEGMAFASEDHAKA